MTQRARSPPRRQRPARVAGRRGPGRVQANLERAHDPDPVARMERRAAAGIDGGAGRGAPRRPAGRLRRELARGAPDRPAAPGGAPRGARARRGPSRRPRPAGARGSGSPRRRQRPPAGTARRGSAHRDPRRRADGGGGGAAPPPTACRCRYPSHDTPGASRRSPPRWAAGRRGPPPSRSCRRRSAPPPRAAEGRVTTCGRSSRRISRRDSRQTMGRPCGQKNGVYVYARSSRSRAISPARAAPAP